VKCDPVEKRQVIDFLTSPPPDFSALKYVQAKMLFNF